MVHQSCRHVVLFCKLEHLLCDLQPPFGICPEWRQRVAAPKQDRHGWPGPREPIGLSDFDVDSRR